MAEVLHAQPCDIRRWTYVEFIDRVEYIDARLEAVQAQNKER